MIEFIFYQNPLETDVDGPLVGAALEDEGPLVGAALEGDVDGPLVGAALEDDDDALDIV